MAMSKKDYIQTAEVMAEFKAMSEGFGKFDDVAFRKAVANFAYMFQADNPRFNRELFIAACNA
tara:strand:- start:86 stop:274 length:189 start_codon:yes stop_codon:yes gene_type:complete